MVHDQDTAPPTAVVRQLDDERARFYGDLVLNSLNEATLRALETMMKGYQYQSDFAKKYFAEGRTEGRTEEAGRALLTVLRARGIAVPDAVRERAHVFGVSKNRRRPKGYLGSLKRSFFGGAFTGGAFPAVPAAVGRGARPVTGARALGAAVFAALAVAVSLGVAGATEGRSGSAEDPLAECAEAVASGEGAFGLDGGALWPRSRKMMIPAAITSAPTSSATMSGNGGRPGVVVC